MILETDLHGFKRRGRGRPSKAEGEGEQVVADGQTGVAEAKQKRQASIKTAKKKALKKLNTKKAKGN